MLDAADEIDRPTISADACRRLRSQFASGVTVVTVRSEAETRGMTVSAFAAVSLEPPLVLVCLDRRARTLAWLLANGRFCVSILSSGQQVIADHFAGRGSESDRVMDDVLMITPGGAAAVRDCLAYLECRVVTVHEAGDHQVVIGLVEDSETVAGMLPLVHWRRRYYALSER